MSKPQALATKGSCDPAGHGILDTFPSGQAAGKSSKCYLSSNSPLWSGHHCINNSPWGWVSESSTNLCKEPGTHSFLHHNHSQSWAEKKENAKNCTKSFSGEDLLEFQGIKFTCKSLLTQVKQDVVHNIIFHQSSFPLPSLTIGKWTKRGSSK